MIYNIFKRIDQRLIFTTLLLSAPLLLGAGDSLAKYQDEISRMSQAERDHLQNNFKAFKSADQQAREQAIAFNTELQADYQKGGNIMKTMDSYIEWLNTISPYDRAALREEKDPGKRVQLVEQILAKREVANPTLRLLPMILSSLPNNQNRMLDRFIWGKSISMYELDRVVELLKSKMPETLPIEYQGVKTARGVDKIILVLRWWAVGQTESKNWVDDALLADIKKLIRDEELIRWINEHGSTESRMFVLVTLLRSTIYYEVEELARKKELTHDDYDNILKKVDNKQKLFLSSLTASDTHHFLSNLAVLQDVKDKKTTLKSTQLLMEVSEKHLRNFNPRPRGPGFQGDRPDRPGGDGRPPFNPERDRPGKPNGKPGEEKTR